MKNRQSIENVVRKVNKLSYDTFLLKTNGAEMNAPGRSNSRPNVFFCIRYLLVPKNCYHPPYLGKNEST